MGIAVCFEGWWARAAILAADNIVPAAFGVPEMEHFSQI